ncbi:tRNA adenosine(34) deaminase TadA [Timonella sp. A28]|uniref:tRNA adenosine(34) deaminase TadA n=1 Tax=Timonella sp. A28 TaxID=3442640 RepID=UPI003EB6E640
MSTPGPAAHTQWHDAMGHALTEAQRALREHHTPNKESDVPIGAVVVDSQGRIIGRGHNQREETHDPTAHAELQAIRQAASVIGDWRLAGCTLVVTLEPCAMCAGAILLARIPRIVIGAWDPKAGATGSVWDIVRDPRMNHFTEVIADVRTTECAQLLTDFFTSRR